MTKPKLPTVEDIALEVRCPECNALPDERCTSTVTKSLRPIPPHEERYKLAMKRREEQGR